jgi:hypothetical protein
MSAPRYRADEMDNNGQDDRKIPQHTYYGRSFRDLFKVAKVWSRTRQATLNWFPELFSYTVLIRKLHRTKYRGKIIFITTQANTAGLIINLERAAKTTTPALGPALLFFILLIDQALGRKSSE